MRVIVNRVPKNPVIIRRFGTFRYVEIHSRERMTVNHDVTGSSPVGGAKNNRSSKSCSYYFLSLKIQQGSKVRVKKTVQCTVFSGRGIHERREYTRRIKRALQLYFADIKVGGAKNNRSSKKLFLFFVAIQKGCRFCDSLCHINNYTSVCSDSAS